MGSSSKIVFYTEPVMNTDHFAMLKFGEGKDMKIIHAVGNSHANAIMNMRPAFAPLMIDTINKLIVWRKNSYVKTGRAIPAEVATAMKMMHAAAMLCRNADMLQMVNMLVSLRPHAVELMPKNECVLWRRMMALIKWAEYLTRKNDNVVQ